MEQPVRAVAHVLSNYLFPTGTWIYSQLVNARRYRCIVLTNRTENLRSFPFKPVYAYESVSPLHKALLCLREGRIRGASDPFFEEVLRRENVGLLQAHFGYMGVAMLGLKARMKVPLVTTFYGADATQLPRDPRWRESYKRLFDVGELFLVEGSAMRGHLLELGCPEDRVIVQRLGIPVDTFAFAERKPDPSGRVRVLIAATFREKKGIPNALLAVERVRERYPQLEATLIGDSTDKPGDAEEKQKILPLLSRLGSGVKWLGLRSYSEYIAALKEHHIFLSPSITAGDGDSEGGAPVSLIEAQATGMPVVSTKHEDIPEIVLDGRSGFLSPENDLDALVCNLERLVTAPDLWARMGRAGRAHIEANHDIQTQMGKLESIYGSVLERETPVYSGVQSVVSLLMIVVAASLVAF
jgi:colanic acid/amylovoran biosynthesis glycosyltransferase